MIKPLGKRVIIKQDIAPEKSEGGIYLPGSDDNKLSQGSIVAVGMKVEDVKLGDVVIFGKYTGTEIEHDKETYLVVNESDIIGVTG